MDYVEPYIYLRLPTWWGGGGWIPAPYSTATLIWKAYYVEDKFNLKSKVIIKLHLLQNVPRIWPPLWSSGQSSWLQIPRSGFDPRGYQIFWEVVDMEYYPFSIASTIEELLGR
jgi:hypothetical protein